ncbi:MAG TPA: class I SAM-dependent methyltransferase [Gallionella sp.]|jgi:SAM-dependent methyltransferase|nr:class I SAM-dependent methyltransferase [Gallionella sp.]
MKKPSPNNHWDNLAIQWSKLASPLRPCHEDVGIIRQFLEPDGNLCLLLGVTPEFTSLPIRVIAMDNSAGMIRALWPDNKTGHNVVRGDWLDMPFAANSFDTIIGDGSLALLSYPLQYERLFIQLNRTLKPGGKILIRFFLRPEQGETCADVCQDAFGGRIGSFHAFKWRLSMAVAAESQNPNISVADTYAVFSRLLPDRKQLAKVSGWSHEDIATIDLYHGSPARYSYPTLSQLRQVLPQCLKETGLRQGSYELAERCPTLVLESCP